VAIYKRSSSRQTVTLLELQEVAVRHGWVDTQTRRIDDDRYAIRFVPRRPGSTWGPKNRGLALRQIERGRMTARGLAALPPDLAPVSRREASGFGVESAIAPLRRALLRRPGPAFGRGFDDPALGFLHPVDLAATIEEHEVLVALLQSLGVDVELAAEGATADSVYAFDPLLVTATGAIALRSGKPNRRGEEADLAAWCAASAIPVIGGIGNPGTADGGDAFWVEPGLLAVGRSLRTNDEGIGQLAALVDAEVLSFDIPYWHGPAECLHLLSVISPVADDLAVVYPPLLPSGLARVLEARGVRAIPVPESEFATLGCNVLAVAPRVVVVAEGNPITAAALTAAGCDVHPTPLRELGINGSGGPTCLVLPVLRG
jgi:dimethylargininase